jgi:TRAP-type C4-dicarboxylate transport system permease small subunit
MNDIPVNEGACGRPIVLRRIIVTAEQTLSMFGCAVLFGMMMLTVVDVVARYLLASPIRQAFELTEISLAMLIFCGMPAVSLHGTHVVTDLIDPLLTKRAKDMVVRTSDAICAIAVGGLAMILWRRAQSMADSHDRTPVAGIELAPLVYLMAALLVATALVHLMRAVWGSNEPSAAPLETGHA